MSFIYYMALITFVFLSLLLCFVVMLQESKSSGLGSTFGAVDAEQSLFGTSTADVLRKFTGWLVVIFMTSCVFLSLWTSTLGRARVNDTSALIGKVQSEQSQPE